MKAKALQFGKAMSAALFVLLLVAVGSKNALAQTQVATLQHDGEITCFYGSNALSQAYNAAETGDIITLSGGTFSLSSINKAITLRGVGFVADTIPGSLATCVASSVTAEVNNDTVPLTIEGIRFTNSFGFKSLSNPRFIKCYFSTFNYQNSSSSMSNAQFVNCRIGTLSNSGVNASMINCVIWNCSCGIGTAFNSFIYINNGYNTYTINAYNCIIKSVLNGYGLNQYSIARKCIGINNALNSAMKEGCWYYNNYSDVFETFIGSNYDVYTEQLILKEEIANTCIGDDDAQVGIYGGYAPYNPRPSYMVIKRCNVASQSTIDGKLSVDIEVVTEGE